MLTHTYKKKKKVYLFKYIFNNNGCECYQNNILISQYKIINFIDISQIQQIITIINRFKKNFETNKQQHFNLVIRIKDNCINISIDGDINKIDNINFMNTLAKNLKSIIKYRLG